MRYWLTRVPIRSGYDLVRILAAAVLLIAAGLKCAQLSSEPVLGHSILDNRWLLMGLVEFELLFGFWLLANVTPRLNWLLLVGCFSAFTCVSLYKALSGYATCGCFGAVRISPWYSGTVDLAFVAALLLWPPLSIRVPTCAAQDSNGLRVRAIARRSMLMLAAWVVVGVPLAFYMESWTRASGLICSEPIWDVGLVDALRTPTLSHVFTLTNASRKALAIREVRPSCGCMVADGYQRTLLPRASTPVTAHLAVPPLPGPFHKELAIAVQQEGIRWLTLQVVGGVYANGSMYSIPKQINFGAIAPGGTAERTIKVFRYDGTPVKLVRASTGSKALSCSCAADDASAGVVQTIRLRMGNGDLPPGPWAGTVTVHTADKHFPTLAVKVSAILEKPDYQLPRSICILESPPGESQDVILRGGKHVVGAPRIVRASYHGNLPLNIKLVQDESATKALLQISRPTGDKSAGVVVGTVAVRLEHVEKAIEIPITVLCAGRHGASARRG